MIEQDNKLVVAASPHIQSTVSVQKIMLAVTVALLPTLAASAFIFGPRVLLLTGCTVAFCVAFELLWCWLMKKPVSIGDFSAVVTGLLLAYNLPSNFPLWMAAVGAFVAIVITKQLFGGIGFNFANPALVGRIVLQISFTGAMIDYAYPKTYGGIDALAGATPLFAAQGSGWSPIDLLLGTHGGVLGETCAITLLLGGLFLIFTKVISPAIPATYLGGTFLFKLLLELGRGNTLMTAATDSFFYLLAGGLLLGAFFMATDYTTSPYSLKGKLVFGVCLAIITVAIREWSNTVEGVSYALLLMNLVVPFINSACRQKPLGAKKQKKAPKAGKGAA